MMKKRRLERENPSAEGWIPERGANRPEEVREPGAVYQITSRVRDFNVRAGG